MAHIDQEYQAAVSRLRQQLSNEADRLRTGVSEAQATPEPELTRQQIRALFRRGLLQGDVPVGEMMTARLQNELLTVLDRERQTASLSLPRARCLAATRLKLASSPRGALHGMTQELLQWLGASPNGGGQ